MNCTKCELYKTSAVNCMKGVGPVPCKVMLIGDGINAEEELYKQPFMGVSGKVLTDLLTFAGLSRSQFFLSSCVRCRATTGTGELKKNRPAKVSEINACTEHLDSEIDIVKPEVIVCLGTVAAKRILGKTTIQQGEFTYSEKYKCRVFYTYNPGMALRDPGTFSLMQRQFKLLARYLKGESTEVPKIDYMLVDNEDTLNELVERLNSVEAFATDIETSSLDSKTGIMGVIGFSWKAGTGVAVPLVHEDGSPYWEDYGWLKQVLTNKALKIIHNQSFENSYFLDNGIHATNLNWDSLIADFLLNENRDHDLKSLAWLYTPYGGYESELTKYKKEHKFKRDTSYLTIPHNILLLYCATDCAVTFELYEKQKELLEKEKLTWLFQNLMMPFQHVINKIQRRGMQVDKAHLVQLSERLILQSTELQSKFNQLVLPYGGCNPKSPKQLSELFFKKLGLKSVKKVKGSDAESTDKEVLKVLGQTNEIAKALLDYKKLIKKNDYLKSILKRLDSNDRIHTNYSLTIEVTGRISSSKPNLQNCPKEKEMRNIFVATPGYKLAEYDMAAHELRVLTGVAHDEGFLKIFNADRDPHREVACDVFKVKPDDVTDKMRMHAKTINFGISYGRGKYTLAEALGISVEEADGYLKQWFRDHPQIARWVKEMQAFARSNRYVASVLGRRRRFPNLEYANRVQLNEIDRQAINSPIQGSASDLVCLAAIRIDRRFEEEGIGGFIVLTVHDALVCEIKEEQFEQGCLIIKEELERPIEGLDVPLKAEGKFGYKWGEIAKHEDTEVEETSDEEDNEEEESEN